jgi:Flp pilus assembly protein TadD
VLLRTNRVNEAVQALERAVSLNPKSPAALNNLGAAYERKGDIAKAKTMYRQALAVDPRFEEARANLKRLGE